MERKLQATTCWVYIYKCSVDISVINIRSQKEYRCSMPSHVTM